MKIVVIFTGCHIFTKNTLSKFIHLQLEMDLLFSANVYLWAEILK